LLVLLFVFDGRVEDLWFRGQRTNSSGCRFLAGSSWSGVARGSRLDHHRTSHEPKARRNVTVPL